MQILNRQVWGGPRGSSCLTGCQVSLMLPVSAAHLAWPGCGGHSSVAAMEAQVGGVLEGSVGLFARQVASHDGLSDTLISEPGLGLRHL